MPNPTRAEIMKGSFGAAAKAALLRSDREAAARGPTHAQDALAYFGASPQRQPEKKRSHFNARRTTCLAGHSHPSKVEARVCADVHLIAKWDHARVFRNVRLPLLALPPTDAGLPHYCNVDFALVKDGKIIRLIDAKSGRSSRDWERGRAAVEASYGIRVEERC